MVDGHLRLRAHVPNLGLGECVVHVSSMMRVSPCATHRIQGAISPAARPVAAWTHACMLDHLADARAVVCRVPACGSVGRPDRARRSISRVTSGRARGNPRCVASILWRSGHDAGLDEGGPCPMVAAGRIYAADQTTASGRPGFSWEARAQEGGVMSWRA